MSRQEKRQRAESYLKEVLDKKILTPPTKHSSPKYRTYTLLRSIVRTILATFSRHRLFLHLSRLKCHFNLL